MEIVILISLLMIFILLLQDKIVIHKREKKEAPQQKVNPNLPDIMGQPKSVERLSPPNTFRERQSQETEVNPDHLDIEYDENENVGIQIPQEELDDVFGVMPDLEEEEEWHRYGISGGDDGFASGVTFDELTTVGEMLKVENLEPELQRKAVDIVLKIQGTELFSLLESSMEGASQRIAELLDSTILSEMEDSSSTMRKSDLNDFDIGEFV